MTAICPWCCKIQNVTFQEPFNDILQIMNCSIISFHGYINWLNILWILVTSWAPQLGTRLVFFLIKFIFGILQFVTPMNCPCILNLDDFILICSIVYAGLKFASVDADPFWVYLAIRRKVEGKLIHVTLHSSHKDGIAPRMVGSTSRIVIF